MCAMFFKSLMAGIAGIDLDWAVDLVVSGVAATITGGVSVKAGVCFAAGVGAGVGVVVAAGAGVAALSGADAAFPDFMLSLIAVPSLFGVALIPSLVFTLKKAVGLGAMGSFADSIAIALVKLSWIKTAIMAVK